MKTQPFGKHQVAALAALAANPEHFYIAGEQGTGKTWITLAEAEARFLAGDIDALLVVAPNGGHTNWVTRQAPEHLEVPWRALVWHSTKTKRRAAELERLLRPQDPDERTLRILAVAVDALNTKDGKAACAQFLRAHRTIMVVDEASDIKNLQAARTDTAIQLGQLAAARRCLDGTPETENPAELFAQFEFLKPGGGLLGTTSYRAFVAEYAVLHPPRSGVVRKAMERSRFGRKFAAAMEAGAPDEVLARMAPQIIQRDAANHPKYKNLEKLNAILQQCMFRVLKKDCLDLPDKLYDEACFELTAEQRRVYERLESELLLDLGDGRLDTVTALVRLNKLRQVTSGFVMRDGAPARFLPDGENPRLGMAERLFERLQGKPALVWAVYREELAALEALARRMGVEAVAYHGGVSRADRELAVERLNAGDAQLFIAQPRSAGRVLTLNRAKWSFYVSNDFSLRWRLQTEDRNHRIGQEESPTYVDLIAVGTADEGVRDAHRAKKSVADLVVDGRGLRREEK